MTATTLPRRRLRGLGAVGVLALALTAGSAGAVSAASVSPIPVDSGNPTCADFGGWDEVKADPPANGVFTDGVLVVTISNFQQSSSGTPGAFDWSSNIGVDAVFVKAGSDKHQLYVYDPESTAGTDLGPQAGEGNGISHVSFCYDTGDPTPTPPASEAPTPTPTMPPSEAPTPEPSGGVEPSEAPSVPPAGTPAPTGGVGGATGTPSITLPPTDGMGREAVPSSAPIAPLLAVLGLLATVATIATARMARRRA